MTQSFFSQETNSKFNHILITNDDGIENIDILIALAMSMKLISNRVSIVVSTQDRSGSSNYLAFGKYKSSYEITTEYFDENKKIGIFTIPAYPADCVLLSLSGLFSNDRPDLVLSGINGGSNIGPAWFNSGTIGAVRTATFLGVKGISFSGFDDDNKDAFRTIPAWIAKFLDSGIIEKIEQDSYLTVAFPEMPLDKIKGIKISKRRISYSHPKAIHFNKVHGGDINESNGKTIWAFAPKEKPSDETAKDDVYYLVKGFIIISAMTINENNEGLLEKLKSMESILPKFND